MYSRTYEITFTGQAGTVLRAEFDDCDVSVGPGTTTLRAELPDQGALHGLLQRIAGLRLELIDVHMAAPPSGSDRCSRPRLPRLSASGKHPPRFSAGIRQSTTRPGPGRGFPRRGCLAQRVQRLRQVIRFQRVVAGE